MAIGAGWVLGADLMVPNTASVRFRFPSGIALEPFVVASITQSSEKEEISGFDSKTTSSDLDLQLGAQLRYPLASRGPLDLLLLGGASIGIGHDEVDPDGPMNETTTDTLTLGLSWGLGLELFLGRRWALSFDALNPLASVSRTKREMDDFQQTNVDITAGAVFDPTIRALFHLYFD
jgi:hypothetical protein